MRLAFSWEEVPDAGWDRSHHGTLDFGAVFRVEDAERDDGEPGRRENEREEERIFEDLPREMPHVPEHAQRAENYEHPPLQEHGEHYEAGVDETIEEPIQLVPAFEEREPAPEGEHPEEVTPERVVLLRSPVHYVRADQHDEPEDEGYDLVALRLVVVLAIDERG